VSVSPPSDDDDDPADEPVEATAAGVGAAPVGARALCHECHGRRHVTRLMAARIGGQPAVVYASRPCPLCSTGLLPGVVAPV
jgi:hypothetical protein